MFEGRREGHDTVRLDQERASTRRLKWETKRTKMEGSKLIEKNCKDEDKPESLTLRCTRPPRMRFLTRPSLFHLVLLNRRRVSLGVRRLDEQSLNVSEKMQAIQFYKTDDKYGCFSNFAAFPIHIDNKLWPTSEHYFQAQKFAGTSHEEAIRKAHSPMIAARMGRDRSKGLRPDWESIKDEVMLKAVRAKFAQHKTLAEILLNTGDTLIVEHTKNDSYWGDGGHGRGKNMLGQILMRVRDELRGPAR